MEYKGFTFERFEINWTMGNVHKNGSFDFEKDTMKVISYIINSPFYLQSTPDKPKSYLPLFCENKKGNVINFRTVKSVKNYISKYMVKKLGKVVIKNGDEAHFELLKESN